MHQPRIGFFCLLFLMTIPLPFVLEAEAVSDPILGIIEKGDARFSQNPTQAVSFYEEALKLAVSKNQQDLAAMAYAKLGKTSFLTGDHYAALRYHRRAFEIYSGLNQKKLAAGQLSQIGQTYYFSSLGDLKEAESYFKQAIEAYRKEKDIPGAALNMNYSAYILWAKGMKNEALQMHLAALKAFEQIDDHQGSAIALSDVGFTLNSLQRYEEALGYHFRALTLEEELDDPIMMIPTLNNIGIAYQGLGDYEKALEFSQQSLKLAQEKLLPLRQKEAFGALHATYHLQGDDGNAYQALLQFHKLDEQLYLQKQEKQKLEIELSSREHERESREQWETQLKQKLSRSVSKQQRIIAVMSLVLVLMLAIVIWIVRQGISAKNAMKKKEHDFEISSKLNEVSLHELREQLQRADYNAVELTIAKTLGHALQINAREILNPTGIAKASANELGILLQRENLSRPMLLQLQQQTSEHLERLSNVIQILMRFNTTGGTSEPERFDLKLLVESSIFAAKPSLPSPSFIEFDTGSTPRWVKTRENCCLILLYQTLQIFCNQADSANVRGVKVILQESSETQTSLEFIQIVNPEKIQTSQPEETTSTADWHVITSLCEHLKIRFEKLPNKSMGEHVRFVFPRA